MTEGWNSYLARGVLPTPPTILILCTGNSCRSHMGEALLRAACMNGRTANVISGGSNPSGKIHPLAIKCIEELGLDLSRHYSKSMNVYLTERVDVVITVCGNADQVCPNYPTKSRKYHWPFDDPSHTVGTDEEIWADFIRVRDLIRAKMYEYAADIAIGKL